MGKNKFYCFLANLFISTLALNIIYIDNLNANNNTVGSTFNLDILESINVSTKIDVLLNNTSFEINRTLILSSNITLENMGNNNSIMIRNGSIVVQNYLFNIQGFSLIIENSDNVSPIFFVLNEGLLIFEDLIFSFSNEFFIDTIIVINGAVFEMINSNFSNQLNPKFRFLIKANCSFLKLEGLIIQNNYLNENVLINGLDSQIIFENISISGNQIVSDNSSFFFFDFSENSQNDTITISQLYLSHNQLNSTLWTSNNNFILNISDSVFENNLMDSIFYVSYAENLFIFNSTFNQNIFIDGQANQTFGGILNIYNSKNIVLNSLFIFGSYSETMKIIGIYGVELSYLLIISCSFYENSVNITITQDFTTVDIGVVFNIEMTDEGSVVIENSVFSQNLLMIDPSLQIQDFQGVPCGIIMNSQGKLQISQTTFENHLSSDHGLCLDLTVQTIILSETTFYNNSVVFSESLELNTMRGVLYIDFSNITIFNSIFSSNQANLGTSIIIKLESLFEFQTLYMNNSLFVENYAYDASNAIYIDSNEYGRMFFVENCSFLYGQSDGLSGVFFFVTTSGSSYQNYSFYQCDFIQNAGSYFGAIAEHYPTYPNSCFLYFELCQFVDNFLTVDDPENVYAVIFDVWGEALESLDDNNFAVHTKNCFFMGHWTYLAGVSNGNRVLFLDEGSVFENNGAVVEGGVFLLTKAILLMINSTVFNATAGQAGGFLALKEGSTAYIYSMKVSNCFSEKGGFVEADMVSSVYIFDSEIEKCEADVGSLFFLSNGFNAEIVISNCFFSNNNGSESFQILSESFTVSIINVIFLGSSELLLLSNCFATISNVTVLNMTCSLELSGCFGSFIDQSTAFISNIIIENLQTNSLGGIFYVYYSNLTCVSLESNQITNEGLGSLLYSDISNIFINSSNFSYFKYDGLRLTNSNCTIQNTIFNNGESIYSLTASALFCFDCNNLIVINCSFLNIFSTQNGSCIYLSGSTQILQYEIINSIFKNNTSLISGGALYHNKLAIGIVSNSSFEFQSAKIGGVLVFDCSNIENMQCTLNLYFNKFSNNYASYEGGVLKWNYIAPQNISSNTFVNNSANVYGDIIANIPIRYGLNVYQNNETIINYFQNNSFLKNGLILNGSNSGDVLSYQIELFLLDSYNKLYTGSNDLSMKVDLFVPVNETSNYFLEDQNQNITKNNLSYLFGTTTINIQNDSFYFDKISIVSTPNSTAFLRFYTSSINSFFEGLLGDLFPNEYSDSTMSNNPYVYILPMQIRLCSIGEIYDTEKNTCDSCPAGKYNFDNSTNTCYDCFSNAFCQGGSSVIVQSGFWRSNYFSINVYQCDESLNICDGGVGPECAQNYQGRMCEECAEDENGNPSSKNIFGECIPCTFTQKTVWLNIGFILLFISLYGVLVKIFLNENVDSEPKILIRILINYFQDLYFFPVRNNPMNKRNQAYRWINENLIGFSGNLFSYDCFYVNFGFNDTSHQSPSIFNRLIFFLCVCFIFLLFLFIISKMIQLKNKKPMNVPLVISIFLWIYIIYPFLTLKSIQPFNCITIDGSSFVQSNLDIQCWNFYHILGISILCLPNIFLWMLILPSKLFFHDFKTNLQILNRLMTKSLKSSKVLKKEIQDIELKSEVIQEMSMPSIEMSRRSSKIAEQKLFHPKSNIFYVGYKGYYFNWEKFDFFKKIILVFCAGLLERDQRRLFFSLLVYFVYFLFFFVKKPLRINYLNDLESWHTVVFVFSYHILITGILNSDFQSDKMVLIVVIFCHFSFLGYVAIKLALTIWKNNIVHLHKKNKFQTKGFQSSKRKFLNFFHFNKIKKGEMDSHTVSRTTTKIVKMSSKQGL